ncbi:hypothetical protein [Rhodanobacter sp. Root480]|uniref:hypothetical protein n=1 Tax=Rhodanobacter sp. Root480 TaxID=1736542 RepID=UPI000AF61D20|nr:hypothetical protein [Rhodanobacter sp. Root480]
MNFISGSGARVGVRLLPLLGYLAFAIGVIGANPFAGETVGPFDLLVAQAGWTVPDEPVTVRSRERSDVLDSLLPSWVYQRDEIRKGHLSAWNPLPAGGRPGIQDLSNAELTPAFAIFSMAPNAALGFYLATLFNLAMAGWGAHLWLRRRATLLPSIFGAVTIMLCGFHTAWLYWPHTLTSIWIGWLLWSIDRWWKTPSYGRFISMVGFSVLLLLGGFPFVVLLGAGSAALYLLCLCAVDNQPRAFMRVGGFGVAWIVAMLLCAIPLISFLTWFAGFDVSYRSGGSSLHLPDDARFLLPHFAKLMPRVESTMYVGLLGLVLGLLAFGFILWRRGKVSVLGLYSLLLGAVAATLVFEIIPAPYLSWVPGLAHNPWSRSIIILDIALAVASAFLLNEMLTRIRWKLLVQSVFVSLIAYQAVDLASLFRQFNGPVPVTFFYPENTLLTKINKNIRPFQSVITDRNFLISGTLGYYGIPEWFAHAFKSTAIKSVLDRVIDDPFTTPTATLVMAKDIRMNSPAMSALGVRYVLGGAEVAFAGLRPNFGQDVEIPVHKPLPPMPGHEWVQSLNLVSSYHPQAMLVRLATYSRADLVGEVVMTLYRDGEAEPIARSVVDASTVLDNHMAVFQLPKTLVLAPGNYRFIFSYQHAGATDRITAWYTPAAAENCSLRVDGNPISGCIEFDLAAPRDDAGTFVPVASDNGMHLMENTNVPSGPYFLPTLSAWPGRESSNEVRLLGRDETDFTLEYLGTRPGFVVVPMNFPKKDWLVRMDGTEVFPEWYLGGLPAFSVNGPTTLEFSYRPNSLRYGTWISLITLLGLLSGWAFFARRRRGASPNTNV